jgi:pyruvate/2-oxoglutarate dehydrogenase complex dihydrolipoamide acyltransferase (E2) component
MPEILRMPEIAANMTEAVLVSWMVPPGAAFAAGETLVTIETEKAIVDVPAEAAGVVLRHLAVEGAIVAVGSPIAILGAVGVVVDDLATVLAGLGAPSAPIGEAPPGEPVVPAPEAAPPAPSAGLEVVPRVGGRIFASPLARRLAREAGVDLRDLAGSGPGGRIRRRDVEAFVAGRTRPAAPAAPPSNLRPAPAPIDMVGTGVGLFPVGVDEVLVPLTRVRREMAARMSRALAVPHAWAQVEVDASGLVRLRDGAQATYLAREGLALSAVPFVVKAVVEALRRHPGFNAAWTDRGLLAMRPVNVGVAVAVDDGLIAPVIREAERLSINGLNKAMAEVAGRARAGTLRPTELVGGTFTVEDAGRFGSNLAMPLLNVPEVAILAMGAIAKRAVVLDTPDGDAIGVRPVMNLVMGFDHRANDGAQAGSFLRDVKAWLEAVGPATSIY